MTCFDGEENRQSLIMRRLYCNMGKSKTIYPTPLLDQEIKDVKEALKSKDKIYDNVEDLIKDLRKNNVEN